MKTAQDRSFMHILYAMHTVAWASAGSLAVVALIVNYVRRADETDALYRAHHVWMIRTFWWTLLSLVLTAPLWLLWLPGVVAYAVIGLWYLYRCLKGWLRFVDGRFPVETETV